MQSTAKRDVLTKSVFGSRIAEDDVDLEAYFVETEQWRKVLAGDVDIVFGAKGAGKSALYSLLVAQKDQMRLGRRTIFLAAENPRGTPAFRDLAADPPVTEEQFRGLWKLYFLALAAQYMQVQLDHSKTHSAAASQVISFLTQNDLLAPNVSLISRLKSVLAYIRNHLPAFEGSVVEPNTGISLKGKITLAEPTPEQRGNGHRSLDELLTLLDEAYVGQKITVWLILDRLDVAFTDSSILEGNALRSLFRTYLDMVGLSNIAMKIFLRDDIWKKIITSGFREASHITRTTTLAWDHQTLQNLIVRRLVSNEILCKLFEVDKEGVLTNEKLQTQFFYRVFPAKIDIGKGKPKTLDWMLSRTADGTKQTAPRELIHLLLESRDQQLKLFQVGGSDPPSENLFDKTAMRSAMPAVSKARYEQTLCAERPSLKGFMDKLEREKTQQTIQTLTVLWKCSAERAADIAEQLVEAGFFERRGSKDSPLYWVPFLYRDALDLVQGAA